MCDGHGVEIIGNCHLTDEISRCLEVRVPSLLSNNRLDQSILLLYLLSWFKQWKDFFVQKIFFWDAISEVGDVQFSPENVFFVHISLTIDFFTLRSSLAFDFDLNASKFMCFSWRETFVKATKRK